MRERIRKSFARLGFELKLRCYELMGRFGVLGGAIIWHWSHGLDTLRMVCRWREGSPRLPLLELEIGLKSVDELIEFRHDLMTGAADFPGSNVLCKPVEMRTTLRVSETRS